MIRSGDRLAQGARRRLPISTGDRWLGGGVDHYEHLSDIASRKAGAAGTSDVRGSMINVDVGEAARTSNIES